jgi:hypothetical protein
MECRIAGTGGRLECGGMGDGVARGDGETEKAFEERGDICKEYIVTWRDSESDSRLEEMRETDKVFEERGDICKEYIVTWRDSESDSRLEEMRETEKAFEERGDICKEYIVTWRRFG